MTISIERYPKTTNRSLKAWNAADELIVNYIAENDLKTIKKVIVNDSFGFLSAHFLSDKDLIVSNFKSQELAIRQNLIYNKIDFNPDQIFFPTQKLEEAIEVGVIKVPKSFELFELYLKQIAQSISETGVVVCGFMTRHFAKGMLEIAEKYFDVIEQSRAVKKARLLILKQKKVTDQTALINSIDFNGEVYKQYYGVFSSGNIDYATQFLIEHIDLSEAPKKVLDLASGNGILAKTIQKQLPNTEIHLMDDSYLAIESSKLNIKADNVFFMHNNSLDKVNDGQFDYVISNPPFHVEHEIDINLPIGLFAQVHRCLNDNGSFQLVSNLHLNYATHLKKIFNVVEVTAKNDKFEVLTCKK